MPAVSERQRRFMGAELSRHRRGKKTRTDMSESQLEDFVGKSMGDVVEKNVVKTIDRYLGKDGESQQDLKDALQRRMKPMPDTGIRIGPAGEETNIYAAGIRARKQMGKPSGVSKQENDYPPIKGERRDAKRAKAKKMKVTGAGTKNLQRIIGQKAKVAGGVDKGIDPVAHPKEAAKAKKEYDRAKKEGKIPPLTAPNPMSKQEEPVIKAITTYIKEGEPQYNKKAVDTEIKRDKSIGKKEAKAIHGLLRGRQRGKDINRGIEKIVKSNQLIKAISAYLKDGQYTHEEAKVAFDRDAAKVMSARQQKRDAELRQERGRPKKKTDIDKEAVAGTCGGGATTTGTT